MSKTVMIVAGETSGELYGALLAGKIKSLWPDARIIGSGGNRMRQAGVELFDGIASSFGVVEAISTLKALRESFRKTVDKIKTERPGVVVLIDYPDFNFNVGIAAKKAGVPVLYYVSPQVWAWRKGRVRKMPRVADRIAVLLPFEESLYREVGMDCEFVGHPIMDEISRIPGNKTEIKRQFGMDPEKPCMALLPGSRKHELDYLLPVILETVRKWKGHHPGYSFVMPLAPNVDAAKHADEIGMLENEGVVMTRENAVLALGASEAAVVASGTAALQSVFVGTPLVVIYKVFPLTYWLGRLLVRNVKYISLVNILLDRLVVKELLQADADPAKAVDELRAILYDEERRDAMMKDFKDVRRLFEGKRPSMRVAEIIGEMAGWKI